MATYNLKVTYNNDSGEVLSMVPSDDQLPYGDWVTPPPATLPAGSTTVAASSWNAEGVQIDVSYVTPDNVQFDMDADVPTWPSENATSQDVSSSAFGVDGSISHGDSATASFHLYTNSDKAAPATK